MKPAMQVKEFKDSRDHWKTYTTHLGCPVRQHVGVNAFGQTQLDVILGSTQDAAREHRPRGVRQ